MKLGRAGAAGRAGGDAGGFTKGDGTTGGGAAGLAGADGVAAAGLAGAVTGGVA